MKRRSNFTPMERFHEILAGHGLNAMNVGINHIRVFLEGKKLFDYYPLRMKLFDYHNWHQLTYPSFGNGESKWENELTSKQLKRDDAQLVFKALTCMPNALTEVCYRSLIAVQIQCNHIRIIL